MIHIGNKIHMPIMELGFHPMVQMLILQLNLRAMRRGMPIHTVNKRILRVIHMEVLVWLVLLIQRHHPIHNINRVLSILMGHRVQQMLMNIILNMVTVLHNQHQVSMLLIQTCMVVFMIIIHIMGQWVQE